MLISMVVQIGELLCYLLNHYYLHKHDTNMMNKSVISAATFHKRKQHNVFTMFGQMYSFMVRAVFSVVMLLASNIGHRYSYNNIMEWMNLFKFTEFGIVSTVQVYTSIEIRAVWISFKSKLN